MKIVINACHGGFGLSPLATKELAKKRGMECYFFNFDREEISLEVADKIHVWAAYSVPNPKDYKLDERGEDGTYKDANERARKISLMHFSEERTDPDLIAVVEKLGDKASDKYAKLKIVEIPDDVDWEIEEYDGLEWVAEKHRTWS